MTIDPITLSVIGAGLQQVCDEMDLTFSRAAFSPVIAEANDRSDGIYAADDGSLIAQGAGGLPVFVGTMQFSTRTLIEMIADGRVMPPEPEDIYIVNDPYLGGTHLMDVRFAKPVYRGGEIFCWLSNTGHWPDIGGSVPGGFSASATAVEQEGLRLPPVKLFKRGEMDREIYAIICSNIRVAEQRIGDVRAQASALQVGEERLGQLLDRYGDDTVRAAIAELRGRAAQQMRARIAEIPDGTYHSRAIVDSDGVVNEPLEIVLAVTKADGGLSFDFAGSSPPCQGPMNSVLATTLSSVYLAMRHIFPDVPMSAGAFEPLEIITPTGTFLDAHYPRPVSGHGRVGPQGALGGADGAPNEVTVWRDGVPYVPEHLSKEQDIALKAGDRVEVKTHIPMIWSVMWRRGCWGAARLRRCSIRAAARRFLRARRRASSRPRRWTCASTTCAPRPPARMCMPMPNATA